MVNTMFKVKGLSSDEVISSRKKYGTNKITERKRSTIFGFVLESLNDPIIKILLVALGIKIMFFINDSDIYETIGIIVAIILATVISSLSEYGSEKAFLKLSKSTSNIIVKVFRDGVICNIPIDEVVVGDYVYLESGDKVSADGLMYEGSVYIDESMLSGESKEQHKTINSSVFRGSVVVSGSGVFVVKSVGNETYYGKIARDIQEKSPESPLKNRLRVLANTISKIGYLCAFLVIVSYLFNVVVVSNGFNLDKIISMISSFKVMCPHLLYSLTLGITIIVVAVPDGLHLL